MIMLAFGAGGEWAKSPDVLGPYTQKFTAQPILQSIVAASCEPSKSGEVLSAIQIVGAIAEIVSLVGLGGIMTAFVKSHISLGIAYLLTCDILGQYLPHRP